MQTITTKRIALILGLLGALGPLSIDLYLPGMPQIAAHLGVGEGDIQFSLMTFFAGLMIGQLFYGPISDRIGRKPVICAGLLIFIAASVGCAMAATASQLIAWRFIQGLGGSIGMVIGMAIVRDLYTGKTAAMLVAMIMVIIGVAPILAPILGTLIISVAPWQTLFALLAAFGALILLLIVFALPETRSPVLRQTSHPLAALRTYGQLLIRRDFIACVATLAFTQAGFFAYLSGSSFVFINVHGVSPATYSMIFAANAIGLMAGAQAAPRLLGRFSAIGIIRTALLIHVTVALLLSALEFESGLGLWLLAALLFVNVTAMAFVLPLASMMALDAHGAIAGAAAALMGALQFGAGALASFVVGQAANGTAMPMIGTMACCGVAACLMAFFAFPQQSPRLQNVAGRRVE